jgi:hypothetical protein
VNPEAAVWLLAMFDRCSREVLDPRSQHIGPMFALKNDIEPCNPMDVDSVDYKDPERRWF